MIEWIETRGIGPSNKARVDFASRLNVLRGPNGCGKTFVLDQIWWAITGSHIAETAWPSNTFCDDHGFPRIVANLTDGRIGGLWVSGEWSTAQQRWRCAEVDRGAEVEHVAVYIRSDGLYGFWEPFMPQPGSDDEPLGDWLCLSEREIWRGRRSLRPDAPVGKHDGVTMGMLDDVDRRYDLLPMHRVLEAMIGHMVPIGQRIQFGEPRHFKIGDAREYPTIRTASGDLPIILAPDSVRRVVTVAYNLAWWWREHTRIARAVNRSPVKSLVILCDDPLRGLDGAWRKCFTMGLLEAATRILAPGNLSAQVVMTTTAPSRAFTGAEGWDRQTDQVTTLRPTAESLVAYTRR